MIQQDKFEVTIELRNKATGQRTQVHYPTVDELYLEHKPEFEEPFIDSRTVLFATLGPVVRTYNVEISFTSQNYTVIPDLDKYNERKVADG